MKKTQYYFILFILHTFIAACSSNEEDSVAPRGNNSDITLSINGVTALRTEQDLDVLLKQIGNARYVLLDEASHGTAEFYQWRAAITRRLIQEKILT